MLSQVFLHEWLDVKHPDPRKLHLREMKAYVEMYANQQKNSEVGVYVWVDFCCMPQDFAKKKAPPVDKQTGASKLRKPEIVDTWPGRDCILSVLARADVVTFLCSFARHSQGRVGSTRQPELCSARRTRRGVATKPSGPRIRLNL